MRPSFYCMHGCFFLIRSKDVVACMHLIALYTNLRGKFLCVWLAYSLPQGQLPCSVVRQVFLRMACELSPRVLQRVLALCLICQTFAAEHGIQGEETCVQGFAPAKRTLQATQRIAPRTVMSSSEQVWCRQPWSQICESMLQVYAVAPAEQYDVNKRLLFISAHCKVALQSCQACVAVCAEKCTWWQA